MNEDVKDEEVDEFEPAETPAPEPKIVANVNLIDEREKYYREYGGEC
jgi:hypothetical protein